MLTFGRGDFMASKKLGILCVYRELGPGEDPFPLFEKTTKVLSSPVEASTAKRETKLNLVVSFIHDSEKTLNRNFR